MRGSAGSPARHGQEVDALVPSYISEEEYRADITRIHSWQPAIEEVCRRERLRLPTDIVVTSTRQYPVLFLPPAHFLKLYLEQPWAEGQDTWRRERLALELIAEYDSDLPVPRLIGSDALTDGLWYNLLSVIPGVPLNRVRPELDDQGLVVVADWAGDFLRRLHSLPLNVDERTRGATLFASRVAALVDSAVPELERRRGLPQRLIDQVSEWLPSSEDLAGSADEHVVAHGDLKYKHIFVSVTGQSVSPTGIIDLTVRIAQPMWDLCYIWGDLRHERPATIDAFMARAAFPGYAQPGFPRRALAWAIIQRWDRAYSLPDIEDIATLDELSMRAFGRLGSHGGR